jgi:hypothetical protein
LNACVGDRLNACVGDRLNACVGTENRLRVEYEEDRKNHQPR